MWHLQCYSYAVPSSQDVFRGLPELQHLDLYGNKLFEMSLPADPSLTLKLEYLDMGYNNLTVLPDELAQLHSLKTLKCMNNLLEIVPPSVCNLDLRVLDVSSNPLVQPPVETCERGIYSMRRYYHCLQLEEMRAPDQHQSQQSQPSPSSKCYFRKMKKKSFVRKSFPAALCRPKRCVSEPANGTASLSSGSTGPSVAFRASAPVLESSISLSDDHPTKVPGSLVHARSEEPPPPVRSVSMRLSEGDESTKSESVISRVTDESSSVKKVVGEVQLSATPIIEKVSVKSEINVTVNEEKVVGPHQRRHGSDFSETSVLSEIEGDSSENASNLVGLKEAEKAVGKITVNDTLKVIFVGMALSGKTSIIKRLIEGKDAVIPEKDERTIGVDIYEWDPKTANGGAESSLNTKIAVDGGPQNGMKGDVDVKFSVWDFAGQHVYHVSLIRLAELME